MTAVVSALALVSLTGAALAQGKWTSLKPIPQGEEEVYGTAAGGKVYVMGGLGVFPGWEPKQMLWSFDPASNEWTKLPNIPEGIHHPGFVSVGNKLYSVGGFTIARPAGGGLPAWVASKSLWVYDIDAKNWTKGPDLPSPSAPRSMRSAAPRIPTTRRRSCAPMCRSRMSPPTKYSTPQPTPGRRRRRCSPRAIITAPS
jgi:hypothetical protein